ncbi:unnamed protein product [[Candida] boidinii]|nr:unnamed protein product [[Candida] boidinii]
MGKVRGRRGEKKSKKEEESLGENNDFVPLEDSNENSNSSSGDSKNNIPTTFFGLVDSTELEYFKQAESNLNINAFETPEEKKNFIGSIFEEARGKELKLATNQLCSKLIERIILESNKKQMIQLFNAFNGHFVALSNQKYSSHCLETFFIRAASNVEKELLRENGEAEAEEEEEEEEDAEGSSDAYISFENMFLFILTELKPNMKQMIPNQYASHVLRVLLLILAGKELPSSIESNSILRSKKSKIARKMIEIKDSEDYQRNFQTPSSFKDELTDTLQIIYKDQTSKSLREMAIEKVASPVIQLLVQLEGLVDKKRSFWCLIFNDYEVESDKKEEAFVEYLLSDPVGSHFLESFKISQKRNHWCFCHYDIIEKNET